MVRLKALGQSAIEVGDTRIGPEQPYLFAIALYLIVERGKRIPRQALVDLIWPHVKDEGHARQRFRQALLRLRECGLPIAGDNGTLLLERSAVETDFESIAKADPVEPGLSLEFLPHYTPRISDRFLDWVETQRSRVHAGVQRVFLTRMQQARNRGDWAEVDAVATECLRLDPYNEEAVMARAECAVMRGSKREALSILDDYMEALGSHVGTIGLPAKILRSRIAERLTDQRYAMISEQHFVGRESSMELLLGLLREAKRGAGSAAFIWGEPGIGKSRLVQELTQVAALDGARVVSTNCHPTDAGRPLSAFADLVPVLKTLPGALGCSAQTLSLLQRLTDRNRNESIAPQEAGDAAFLAATIRRAVFDIVDAVADEGLLVMVIEDVHWLDEQSWSILSAMVEWSTTRTLLILLTSRTAHATETKVADPDRGMHRHHLQPLADADSGALLDKLASGDGNPLPDEVREWSVGAAEGNPFYLRELLRHWLETHQGSAVPRSLAELIEGRLLRLSSLAMRVLQLCAMLGKHSTFERLEKATGYQNHVLLDAIEELSIAAMLSPDKPGVAVKHDLLATAALNRLGGAALKLVHRQVATVLEAEINEKHTAALMWDCAEHWQCAGELEHALTTARLCANHLHSVGQLRESIELYEKTLPICVTSQEQTATLQGLVASLQAAGKWSRSMELVARLGALVSEQATPNPLGDHVELLRAESEWRLRVRLEGSIEWLVNFAKDTSKCPEHRLRASHLGMIRCSEERRADEGKSLFYVVERLEQTRGQAALLAHIRMIYHADFGDMEIALAEAEKLLALEAKVSEPGSLARARTNVAFFYRRAGHIREAKLLLQENLAFAIEHSLESQVAFATTHLGLAALQEEDFVAAEQWQKQAMKHTDALDDKMVAHHVGYIGARVGLRRGETTQAEDFLHVWAEFGDSVNFRIRQSMRSIQCLAQLAYGSVDRGLVEALAFDFDKYCDAGQQDFFASTVYSALEAVGERTRAKDVLADYITSRRRDRGPLPPSLGAVVSELRIEATQPVRRAEKEFGLAKQ